MDRNADAPENPVRSTGPVTELQQALIEIGSPLKVHAALVPRRIYEAAKEARQEALRQRPTSIQGAKVWFRVNVLDRDLRDSPWPSPPASVEHNERASEIHTFFDGDGYSFDFQHRGFALAKASSPDLNAAARSIHRWAVDQVSTSQLADEFDFVEAEDWAPVFEEGREVEWRWAEYAESIPISDPWAIDVFEIARNTPELRQLFPFFSMWRLCFSRCTGWPYTYDLPCIVATSPFRQLMRQTVIDLLDRIPTGKGTDRPPRTVHRYKVLKHGGLHLNWWERVSSWRHTLGVGTAEHAIQLVVDNLPENCGPAVPGTAEYL